MWNLLQKEVAIGPVIDSIWICGSKMRTLRPLPIRLFQQSDDGTFAKIVGVLFEREADDAEAVGREIEHGMRWRGRRCG